MNIWRGAAVAAAITVGSGLINTDATAEGLAIGLFGQGTFNNIEFSQTPLPPMMGNGEYDTGNLDGIGIGALVGYDFKLGHNLVAGVVADIAWGDWKENYNNGSLLVGYYDINYLGTVRGRLGYRIMPHVLGYVTGGYAFANVRHGGAAMMAATPATTDFRADGWVLGLGGETKLMGVTVFAEYLHTEFRDSDFVLHGQRHIVDLNNDTIRVGFKVGLN